MICDIFNALIFNSIFVMKMEKCSKCSKCSTNICLNKYYLQIRLKLRMILVLMIGKNFHAIHKLRKKLEKLLNTYSKFIYH